MCREMLHIMNNAPTPRTRSVMFLYHHVTVRLYASPCLRCRRGNPFASSTGASAPWPQGRPVYLGGMRGQGRPWYLGGPEGRPVCTRGAPCKGALYPWWAWGTLEALRDTGVPRYPGHPTETVRLHGYPGRRHRYPGGPWGPWGRWCCIYVGPGLAVIIQSSRRVPSAKRRV